MRKKSNNNRIRLGLSLGARIRYAWSDLRHRSATIKIPIRSIAGGTGIFIVLAFVALESYRSQHAYISSEALTHITATADAVTREEIRFTGERLAALREEEGIRDAYAKYEQGVYLLADSGSKIQIPAEGVVTSDPRIDPSFMAWTGHGEAGGSNWVYLSRRVYQKLGERLAGDAPDNTRLTIRVGRSTEGREEHLDIPVQVAGLIDRQTSDRVFIPHELARRLDAYCSHTIDSLAPDENTSMLPNNYEYALAYVDKRQIDRISEAADYLNIDLERLGEVSLPVPQHLPVWMSVDFPTGVKPSALEETVGGVTVYPERVLTIMGGGRNIRIVALHEADPRWKISTRGKPPAYRELLAIRDVDLALRIGTFPVQAMVTDVDPGFPINGDMVCSQDTLDWLSFRPERAAAVSTYGILETKSIESARMLAADNYRVKSESEYSWRIFDLAFVEPEVTNTVVATVPDFTDVSFPTNSGLIRRAATTARHGVLGIYSTPVSVKFVPDEFFDLMAGRSYVSPDTNEADIARALVVGRIPGLTDRDDVTIAGVEIQIADCRYLDLTFGELWMPDSVRGRFDTETKPDAIAAWGSWRTIHHTENTLQSRELAGPVRQQHDPAVFWAAYTAANDAMTARSDRIPVGVASALVQLMPQGDHYIATINEQNGLSLNLVPQALGLQPDQIEFKDRVAFAEEVFRVSVRDVGSRVPVNNAYSAAIDSALGISHCEREIARWGGTSWLLTPVNLENWGQYRVRDRSSKDGRLDRSLLSIIGMTKPAFKWSMPYFALAGTQVGDNELSVVGSESGDPRQFTDVLGYGAWLSGDGVSDMVLPQSLVPPDHTARGMVGQVIKADFKRIHPVTKRAEKLELAMRVVGTTPGTNAYMQLDLAQKIDAWLRGDCHYNRAKATFETTKEIDTRMGTVRANVIALSDEAVEPVVRLLESLGYRTESSLGQLASLRKFMQSWIIMVVFIAGTILLSASQNVFLSAETNVQSKSWEIGLLKALAISDRDIMSVFMIQGTILGLLGYLLGVLFAAFVDLVLLRWILAKAFGERVTDILSGSLFASENWFIFVIAFLVAVGFSLMGIRKPARKACRMLPVEALNNRD